MDNPLALWAILFATALAYYVVFIVLSRLFFHPLRDFPGPRLAAMTFLYEAYYDIVLDGGLVEQLRKLHEIYGLSNCCP